MSLQKHAKIMKFLKAEIGKEFILIYSEKKEDTKTTRIITFLPPKKIFNMIELFLRRWRTGSHLSNQN